MFRNTGIFFLLLLLLFYYYSDSVLRTENINKSGIFLLLRDVIHEPFDSILQPNFVLLNSEEKITFLKKYNVSENQVPVMRQSDIIARLYNAKKGDVFKIIRKDSKFGYDVYFRIVTRSNYDDVFQWLS